MSGKVIFLTEEQVKEIKAIQSSNDVMEWQAIIEFLKLPDDASFVTRSVGTASNPKPGLIVEFVECDEVPAEDWGDEN